MPARKYTAKQKAAYARKKLFKELVTEGMLKVMGIIGFLVTFSVPAK